MTAIGDVEYQGDTNQKLQMTKGENMTLEASLIDSALRNWRSNVDRAGKLFGNLSQEQLLQEVSPGRNRLVVAMVDLNGHEAGNGGNSQGRPTAHRDL